jgi:hypothetical protein
MRNATSLVVLVAVACRRVEPTPVVRPRGEEIPTARAVRVADASLRVDGRLDEAPWRTEGTGAFVHPTTGQPVPSSRVQARAWFAWSDERLYVAARVGDRNPFAPFRPEEVDPHLWERSSAVELMVQPGDPGDNRVYYEIQADTVCAQWTTRFDDYNRPQRVDSAGRRHYGHEEWSPTIECAARPGPDGYTLELAIPWRAFAEGARTPVPPRVGDVWRVNVYSFRDGQRDALAWSPLRGAGNFHYAPRFGRLVFGG